MIATPAPDPADPPDPAGRDASAGEQVVYRDDDEFNKALDAAAESIRRRRGPDVVGNVIWWGLIAVQAALYGADWAFDLPLRTSVIEGVDLTKPLWLIIGALVVIHFAWTRHQHGRILRGRLCLDCGCGLLERVTDDRGDGVCPRCGRGFNLGEYRRPDENRGRDFRGYLDEEHFEKTLYAVAEHLKKRRPFGLEGELMSWCWLALGISFGSRLLGWDVLDLIPGPQAVLLVWLALMFGWLAWYAARVRRLKPAIVEQRLCMNCGFCLRHTPTNDGYGRCPECGVDFAAAQYRRPSKLRETATPTPT